MQCTNCGKEIKEGERYCTNCWTEGGTLAERTRIDTSEFDMEERRKMVSRMGHKLTQWLNDIEINKITYIAAYVLLILGIVLVQQPAFEVSGYGVTLTFTLHEIDELQWAEMGMCVLNVVCIVALLVPMLKLFEWKAHWFIPTVLTSLIECGVAFYILAKKKELMETTLAGYFYKLFSIELDVTVYVWLLIVTFVLLFLCSVKMLLDVKNNEVKC